MSWSERGVAIVLGLFPGALALFESGVIHRRDVGGVVIQAVLLGVAVALAWPFVRCAARGEER